MPDLDFEPDVSNRDLVGLSLHDFGASPTVQAAILGDIQQESNFNPRMSSDNGTSHGLLQVGTPMFRLYDRDAQEKGVHPDSPEYTYGQTPFVLQRFKQQHPDRWAAMQSASSARDALAIFRSTPDWQFGVAGKRFDYADQYQRNITLGKINKDGLDFQPDSPAPFVEGKSEVRRGEPLPMSQQPGGRSPVAGVTGVAPLYPEGSPEAEEVRLGIQPNVAQAHAAVTRPGTAEQQMFRPTPEQAAQQSASYQEQRSALTREPLFRFPKPFPDVQQTAMGRVGAGLANAPADILNFLGSPEGMVTIASAGGIGELSPVLDRAIALGFSGQQIIQALRSDNLQDMTEAAIGGAIAGKYGLRRSGGGELYAERIGKQTAETSRETQELVAGTQEGVHLRDTPQDRVETETAKVASVPVMITKRMEADLKSRGFSQGEINKMTPQQANEILTTEGGASEKVQKGQGEEGRRRVLAAAPAAPVQAEPAGLFPVGTKVEYDVAGKTETGVVSEVLGKRTMLVKNDVRGTQTGLDEIPAGSFNIRSAEPTVDFVPDEPATVAPKLLPGEKQGDLISSTQSEPFALAGEKGIDFAARQAQAETETARAEEARLKAEHEQGLLEEFQQHQARGGDELIDAINKFGGLPTVDSKHAAPLKGELAALREEWKKGGFSTSGGVSYKTVFKKTAGSLDRLAQNLKQAGFDVETGDDVIEKVRDRLRSGNPVYGSEARGEALEEASFGLPFAFGPGAAARGQSLSTMGQLRQEVQTMHGTVKPSSPKSDSMTESIVRGWAQGKSKTQNALGNMVAGGQKVKEIFRGVQDPSEIRDRVGQYDFEIQQSMLRSAQGKRAMKAEIPDQTLREAAYLWIDSGQDEQFIRDAIPKFPAKTAVNVRRAAEMATNLPPAGKFYAQALKDFYKTRGQEAQSEGVMDELLDDYATHVWQKEGNMPGRLIRAMQSGDIKTYFEYSRQRKIPTLIEGILQGKTPVLDPAETVPFYNHSLDRSIASRRFIADLSELTEADGRPTVSPSGVRYAEVGDPTEAILISPRSKGMTRRPAGTPEPFIEMTKREAETGDYKDIDHPSMRKWVWAGKSKDGAPIFYKGDLMVHPDAWKRLDRMMDRRTLTPSTTTKAALSVSTQVKGLKLGLWSLFHPLNIGTHALFHWTNAFRQLGKGEIDPESSLFQHAVEKGHVKLVPSPQELQIFAEGILQPGLLIHKIPWVGRWSKAQSEWTFTKFIPKLKLATFDNAYRRAIWTRDNLGLYKGLTEDQIAERIGDSVNNAFGELNQQFLGKHGRSPEFQRALRLMFLAPDFGEARARFVGKALTRYGHEERLALATMFVTLYGSARVANMLSTGDPQWDWKHAFELKVGDRWWSMRSVLGDMNRMFADSGQFFYNRLNPTFSRTLVDWLTSRDVYTGRRLSPSEKYFSRPLEQLVPLQLGGITRDDQHVWESFVSSLGLQTHRDNPVADVHKLVSNWKEYSNNPKLRAQWEAAQQETFAQSDYAKMRYALDDDNPEAAYREYYRLRTELKKKPADLKKAFDPNKSFTGSKASERQFLSQLDADGRAAYDAGRQHQKVLYDKYRAMLKEYAGITE